MNVGEGVYQIQRPQANHFGKSGNGKKWEETTFIGLLIIVFDELGGNKGC